MKLELTFGNGKRKRIIENVLSYKERKSLVSGLLYVTVRYQTNEEHTFTDVYKVKAL